MKKIAWLLIVITVCAPYGVKSETGESHKRYQGNKGDTTLLLRERFLANHDNVIWNWDPGYKSFSLKEADGNLIQLSGLGGAVEIDGKTCFLEDAKVVSKPVGEKSRQ